jgi:hypothetical protein
VTKPDAIAKIRKLVALARGTTNDHEKDSAIKEAGRLMREHGVTMTDLQIAPKALVFDAVAEAVKAHTASCPIIDSGLFGAFNVMGEIASASKQGLDVSTKAFIVDRLKGNLDIIGALLGPRHKPLISTIDTILKEHETK